MSDSKTRLFVLVLLVAAVAMLADLVTAPRSKFTAANYERLKIDMTLDDAINILGEPDSIDTSLQDMQWVTWFSPFDSESYIACIFVFPSGIVKSIEGHGRLPDRPLLIPDVLPPKRETPSYIAMLMAHKQDEERRRILMLGPPARASNGPFLP